MGLNEDKAQKYGFFLGFAPAKNPCIMSNLLLNDPLYGAIELPKGLLRDLLNHRYVQRLRRISQLGLSVYVYTGAGHHRLAHALGALHLMQVVLGHLKQRGEVLTEAEELGACVAIFLHDLGHSPFSHSLEGLLVPVPHEALTLAAMKVLNQNFQGALDTAIEIFEGNYPRPFLHQLVSGQLDLDRMDYLNRDSFYTGVIEGGIGYNRLLQLFRVHEDCLALDEKGLYSVEQFLMARRLMYWQVYLHKTGIVASEMLRQTLLRARYLLQNGEALLASPALLELLRGGAVWQGDLGVLENFMALDDTDIWSALKFWQESKDFVLAFLSRSILERRLFKIVLQDQALAEGWLEEARAALAKRWSISLFEASFLVNVGAQANKAYQLGVGEIQILSKKGELKPISAWKEPHISSQVIIKHYGYQPR